VGNDALGQCAVAELQKRHVGTNWVMVDGEHPTSTVPVTLVNGQPTYEIVEGVAWDYIGWVEGLEALAQSADAICFGTLAQRSFTSRATIQRFLQAAPATCLCVLDVNFRQTYHSKNVVEQSLELANVVKLNDAEVPILRHYIGGSSDDDLFLADVQKRFDLHYVVLTLGERGCRIFSSGSVVSSPGDLQIVIDAVGAGDAFTAAFIGSVLSGADLQTSADWANDVGGFVVTQMGATPVLPERFCIF
jgi:fructokinase